MARREQQWGGCRRCLRDHRGVSLAGPCCCLKPMLLHSLCSLRSSCHLFLCTGKWGNKLSKYCSPAPCWWRKHEGSGRRLCFCGHTNTKGPRLVCAWWQGQRSIWHLVMNLIFHPLISKESKPVLLIPPFSYSLLCASLSCVCPGVNLDRSLLYVRHLHQASASRNRYLLRVSCGPGLVSAKSTEVNKMMELLTFWWGRQTGTQINV